MKIVKLETFLTNAGLRNYLFVRLTTDNGLTGVGEASLEWQEKTVETLIHEWVEDRILGADPRDVETNRRRTDPRPIPGRIDGADGHQRRGGRSVGSHRQGLRAAGLRVARRTRRESDCRPTPTAGTAMRERRPNMPIAPARSSPAAIGR